jgi:hypothetical protein
VADVFGGAEQAVATRQCDVGHPVGAGIPLGMGCSELLQGNSHDVHGDPSYSKELGGVTQLGLGEFLCRAYLVGEEIAGIQKDSP